MGWKPARAETACGFGSRQPGLSRASRDRDAQPAPPASSTAVISARIYPTIHGRIDRLARIKAKVRARLKQSYYSGRSSGQGQLDANHLSSGHEAPQLLDNGT